MKAISFSLYGPNEKYLRGLTRNIDLRREFYPGWHIFVFCDRANFHKLTGCADNQRGEYTSSGVTLLSLKENEWCPSMMQRFLVADFEKVERFIIRDADSRLGAEEAAAVVEWINEDTILHTCRAHPAHCRPINGGLWGAMWHRNNWSAPPMAGLIRDYLDTHATLYRGHDMDQHFLAKMIWPWAQASCTQHASVCRGEYPGSKPFPVQWPWPRFMGEVVEVDSEGNESFRDGDWQQIPKDL